MKTKLLVFTMILGLINACSNDDAPTETLKSSEKRITQFVFFAPHNQGLSSDITGLVDEAAKTIELILPFGTNVSALVPHIDISSKARVVPLENQPTDFTNPVAYVVTAEDGTSVTYMASVIIHADTSNKAPDPFLLRQIDNNTLDVAPTPTFKWDSAIDADGDTVSYDLYLDKEADPTTLMAENIADTTFTVPNTMALSLARNYYWQIVAKDGKGGETASEIFTFKVKNLDDAVQLPQPSVSEIFSGRERHASAVFQDQMWVLGGFANGVPSNQPWGSPDGLVWEAPLVNFEERFTPRYFHAATSFEDKMWVSGGVAQGEFANDVWMTTNGGNWDSIAQTQPYTKRSEHTLTAHEGNLWIIGGNSGNGQLADVWRSTDGADWESVTSEAPFGKRNFHQTVSFQGKLWVIGGIDDNAEFKNDVWSSTDGFNWDLVTANAPFSPRGFHKVLVFDDKIWVIGSGSENDIWYSEDGVEWIDATPATSFPVKSAFTTLFYQNKIWILAGSATNEVWSIDYHEFQN